MLYEVITSRYAIDIRLKCEVTAIHRHEKTVLVQDLNTGETFSRKYDKLILATGTTPERPDISGADTQGIFALKDMPDLEAIITHIDTYKVRRAVVVGGGNIGLEVAENLSRRGIKTCVVEQNDHALPSFDADMARFAKRALEDT